MVEVDAGFLEILHHVAVADVGHVDLGWIDGVEEEAPAAVVIAHVVEVVVAVFRSDLADERRQIFNVRAVEIEHARAGVGDGADKAGAGFFVHDLDNVALDLEDLVFLFFLIKAVDVWIEEFHLDPHEPVQRRDRRLIADGHVNVDEGAAIVHARNVELILRWDVQRRIAHGVVICKAEFNFLSDLFI